MDPHDILERLARGELSVAEAEARLIGYATGDAGRFDAARIHRRGVPEAILAPGKTPDEVADLASTAVETTGRAIITRLDDEIRSAVEQRVAVDHPIAESTYHSRASMMVVHGSSFERPSLRATVGLASGGTADAGPLQEARVLLEELGASTVTVDDVGVANLTRMVDQLPTLRDCDVLVVAAGREGALPTVVAGLVDTPVIGLPIASGYGLGGEGEAALLGMLQSCTVLSVVNVDAGYVAGAQAGLIARAIDAARD